MSIQWRNAIRSGLLMFAIYLSLDAVAIRLGWLTHIGWIGGVIASLALAWRGYQRSARQIASGVTAG